MRYQDVVRQLEMLNPKLTIAEAIEFYRPFCDETAKVEQ